MGSKNIYIVGLMGSGKTSIGKLLAKRTNRNFIDTDQEIIKNEKASITDIFNKFGEAYFRKLEAAEIRNSQNLESHIIATGGGVILNNDNINIMQEFGIIVFLDINIKNQLARVTNKKNRPLLNEDNIEKNLIKLRNERYAIYKKISDYIIDTSNKKRNDIIMKISKHIL